MNISNRLFKKFAAGAFSTLFFLQSSFLAHAAEANFWTARQKSALSDLASQKKSDGAPAPIEEALASLSQFSPSLSHPVAQGSTRPSLLPSSLKNQKVNDSIPQWIQQALRPVGSWVDFTESAVKSDRLVVLFQDAHLHKEAQENLAKAVSALSNGILRQPEPKLVIGLEGASRRGNYDVFHAFRHQHELASVVEILREWNVFTGPETALISFNPREKNAPVPFSVLGVEDQVQYDNNVEALKAGEKNKTLAEKALAVLEAELTDLKKEFYQTPQFIFDERVQSFEAGTLSPSDYILYLDSIVRATEPETRNLIEAALLEGAINFDQVQRERAVVLQALVQKMSDKEIQDLLQVSQLYKMGQVDYAAYYDLLKNLAKRKNIELTRFPEFSLYVQYALKVESVHPGRLFEELARLEAKAQKKIFTTPLSLRLANFNQDALLLAKLVRHELTEREWASLASRKKSLIDFSLRFDAFGRPAPSLLSENASLWTPYFAFYETATRRNASMARHLAEEMAKEKASLGILVAGGFHSQGLAQELSDRGASVVTIAPRLSDVSHSLSSLEFLRKDATPLDELFKGSRLFLSLAPTTLTDKAPFSIDVSLAAAQAAATNGLVRRENAAAIPMKAGGLPALARELNEQIKNLKVTYLDVAPDPSGFTREIVVADLSEQEKPLQPAHFTFKQMAIIFISLGATTLASSALLGSNNALWAGLIASFFALAAGVAGEEYEHAFVAGQNKIQTRFGVNRWGLFVKAVDESHHHLKAWQDVIRAGPLGFLKGSGIVAGGFGVMGFFSALALFGWLPAFQLVAPLGLVVFLGWYLNPERNLQTLGLSKAEKIADRFIQGSLYQDLKERPEAKNTLSLLRLLVENEIGIRRASPVISSRDEKELRDFVLEVLGYVVLAGEKIPLKAIPDADEDPYSFRLAYLNEVKDFLEGAIFPLLEEAQSEADKKEKLEKVRSEIFPIFKNNISQQFKEHRTRNLEDQDALFRGLIRNLLGAAFPNPSEKQSEKILSYEVRLALLDWEAEPSSGHLAKEARAAIELLTRLDRANIFSKDQSLPFAQSLALTLHQLWKPNESVPKKYIENFQKFWRTNPGKTLDAIDRKFGFVKIKESRTGGLTEKDVDQSAIDTDPAFGVLPEQSRKSAAETATVQVNSPFLALAAAFALADPVGAISPYMWVILLGSVLVFLTPAVVFGGLGEKAKSFFRSFRSRPSHKRLQPIWNFLASDGSLGALKENQLGESPTFADVYFVPRRGGGRKFRIPFFVANQLAYKGYLNKVAFAEGPFFTASLEISEDDKEFVWPLLKAANLSPRLTVLTEVVYYYAESETQLFPRYVLISKEDAEFMLEREYIRKGSAKTGGYYFEPTLDEMENEIGLGWLHGFSILTSNDKGANLASFLLGLLTIAGAQVLFGLGESGEGLAVLMTGFGWWKGDKNSEEKPESILNLNAFDLIRMVDQKANGNFDLVKVFDGPNRESWILAPVSLVKDYIEKRAIYAFGTRDDFEFFYQSLNASHSGFKYFADLARAEREGEEKARLLEEFLGDGLPIFSSAGREVETEDEKGNKIDVSELSGLPWVFARLHVASDHGFFIPLPVAFEAARQGKVSFYEGDGVQLLAISANPNLAEGIRQAMEIKEALRDVDAFPGWTLVFKEFLDDSAEPGRQVPMLLNLQERENPFKGAFSVREIIPVVLDTHPGRDSIRYKPVFLNRQTSSVPESLPVIFEEGGELDANWGNSIPRDFAQRLLDQAKLVIAEGEVSPEGRIDQNVVFSLAEGYAQADFRLELALYDSKRVILYLPVGRRIGPEAIVVLPEERIKNLVEGDDPRLRSLGEESELGLPIYVASGRHAPTEAREELNLSEPQTANPNQFLLNENQGKALKWLSEQPENSQVEVFHPLIGKVEDPSRIINKGEGAFYHSKTLVSKALAINAIFKGRVTLSNDGLGQPFLESSNGLSQGQTGINWDFIEKLAQKKESYDLEVNPIQEKAFETQTKEAAIFEALLELSPFIRFVNATKDFPGGIYIYVFDGANKTTGFWAPLRRVVGQVSSGVLGVYSQTIENDPHQLDGVTGIVAIRSGAESAAQPFRQGAQDDLKKKGLTINEIPINPYYLEEGDNSTGFTFAFDFGGGFLFAVGTYYWLGGVGLLGLASVTALFWWWNLKKETFESWIQKIPVRDDFVFSEEPENALENGFAEVNLSPVGQPAGRVAYIPLQAARALTQERSFSKEPFLVEDSNHPGTFHFGPSLTEEEKKDMGSLVLSLFINRALVFGNGHGVVFIGARGKNGEPQIDFSEEAEDPSSFVVMEKKHIRAFQQMGLIKETSPSQGGFGLKVSLDERDHATAQTVLRTYDSDWIGGEEAGFYAFQSHWAPFALLGAVLAMGDGFETSLAHGTGLMMYQSSFLSQGSFISAAVVGSLVFIFVAAAIVLRVRTEKEKLEARIIALQDIFQGSLSGRFIELKDQINVSPKELNYKGTLLPGKNPLDALFETAAFQSLPQRDKKKEVKRLETLRAWLEDKETTLGTVFGELVKDLSNPWDSKRYGIYDIQSEDDLKVLDKAAGMTMKLDPPISLGVLGSLEDLSQLDPRYKNIHRALSLGVLKTVTLSEFSREKMGDATPALHNLLQQIKDSEITVNQIAIFSSVDLKIDSTVLRETFANLVIDLILLTPITAGSIEGLIENQVIALKQA